MNSRSSAWTGRAPRSMSEAFNPHCTNDLHPMPEPRNYSAAWWTAFLIAAVIAMVVIVATA